MPPASRVGTHTKTIDQETLFVVEGADEEFLLRALVKAGIVLRPHNVWPAEGNKKIPAALDAVVTNSGFPVVRSLVVICDADDDAKSAFAEVVDALGKRGLPGPAAPGVWSEPGKRGVRTCVYVFPDNAAQGCLETLLLRTIADDPIQACLDAYFACAGEPKPAMREKARPSLQRNEIDTRLHVLRRRVA